MGIKAAGRGGDQIDRYRPGIFRICGLQPLEKIAELE
jgi:hypothetical protein